MELNKIYNESNLDTMARMPDNFVDCVITSPPYYALRSYGTAPQVWGGDKGCKHQWSENIPYAKQDNRTAEQKIAQGAAVGSNINFNAENTTATSGAFCECGAWLGEMGLEPTYQLYLDHLIMVFSEVRRVLKPTGSCWVNLGDSYAGSNGNGYQQSIANQNRSGTAGNVDFRKMNKRDDGVIRRKSLMNIPARFAIRMTEELQFIQRNEIIWHKPACMPSSAKDSFTVDFEPIYFFTKSEDYYFEQQLEPVKEVSLKRVQSGWKSSHDSIGHIDVAEMGSRFANPEGRNMRTTWKVPFEPSKNEHYASYPTKLIEVPIRAGSPPEGIVYDPFGGTATTAVVAHRLGRQWVCSELQPKYADIANERLKPYLDQNNLF